MDLYIRRPTGLLFLVHGDAEVSKVAAPMKSFQMEHEILDVNQVTFII